MMFSLTRSCMFRHATVMSFTLSEYVGYPQSTALWATLTLNRETSRSSWEINMCKHKTRIYLQPFSRGFLSNSVLAQELLCDPAPHKPLHTAQLLSVNGVCADNIKAVRSEMDKANVLVLQLLLRSNDGCAPLLQKKREADKTGTKGGSVAVGINSLIPSDRKAAPGTGRGRGRPRLVRDTVPVVPIASAGFAAPVAGKMSGDAQGVVASVPRQPSEGTRRRGRPPSGVDSTEKAHISGTSSGTRITSTERDASSSLEGEEVTQYHL
uniref:Uncharacterized protein TCIL3000_11_8950 n=1 Tax=Trypanosoma congolense (strain IL3000) TaxID=1068625 RepID=G0V1B7_TRYCI|nr:unnamed protein product [Trypanosoma congolense IL3000]